jgi:pentatricopeptide repeat protein
MREMRKHGGVDPDYATVISGWCKFSRIEDAAKVFDDMLARAVLKNAKVLLLDEASRVPDAVGRMFAMMCRATVCRCGMTRPRRTRVQQMRRKRSSREWTCVQQRHAQESRGAAEAEERLW